MSFRCKSLLFQVLSAKFCDNVLKIFHSEAFPAYPANAPSDVAVGDSTTKGEWAESLLPPFVQNLQVGSNGRLSSPVVNRRELRFSLGRLHSPLQSQGTTVR